MTNKQLRSLIKEVIKESLNQTQIATNPNDIEIIAKLDAYSSTDYLTDEANKEEIMTKYQDSLKKLSASTPEEQYNLFLNTVRYHNSDEAKAERERIENEYNNSPVINYKKNKQYWSDYFSGY